MQNIHTSTKTHGILQVFRDNQKYIYAWFGLVTRNAGLRRTSVVGYVAGRDRDGTRFPLEPTRAARRPVANASGLHLGLEN